LGIPLVHALSGLTSQLLENASFRHDYFPPEVKDFQLRTYGTSELVRFWIRCPKAASKWAVGKYSIMLSFYDAHEYEEPPQDMGFGAAMIALQECILSSGSVDPTSQHRLILSRRGARDHKETIGSLYSTREGVWCESLIPLWETLMHRFHFVLETLPDGGLLNLVGETEHCNSGNAADNLKEGSAVIAEKKVTPNDTK
jgi:hypothetical protein